MFIEATYNEQTGAYIPPKEVLINDTIGFIRELPPKLIDAFKSTLEDSIESDLLLHVIDASDPKFELKIDVVEEILTSIGATQKSIYVINKMDEVDDREFIKIFKGKREDEIYTSKKAYIEEKYADNELIFISATENQNIEELKKLIVKSLEY
jgi:GTP-binding protein HflX